MIFFSQEKQDEFLETNVFKGFKNGFFMDIGAHDGITFNNTLFFERNHQWTGINVEPNVEVYEKLVSNRPTNINVNCAVSDHDGTSEFICNSGYTEMLSGLKDKYDPRHLARMSNELKHKGGESKTVVVETKRIETICQTYDIHHIHYLSIDVEGAEFDVIRSINFDKVFIDVIGFENNFDETSIPIVKYLQEKNYKIIYKGYDIFMIHNNSLFV
jgi:FkbM family methyltransferase